MRRFRSLCFTLALVATALATLAAPSSAIVLSNGLIIVHNRSGVPIWVAMKTPSGATWEGTDVAPGHTFTTERCCYAAGTEYRVFVRRDGGYAGSTYFRPSLCHHNGTLYGFAEFTVTTGGADRTATACFY